MRHLPTLLALLLVAFPLAADEPAIPSADHGLTAVPGVRVGHHVLEERPTGCTVIVAPEGTVGAVDVRGGAPGSRELALLAPWNLVQHVDAVVLAGGSAFGLDAAAGTVRWLEEQGRGYDAGVARVPIVPAAILFDLPVGNPSVRPGPECGYRAAASASTAPVAEGNAGAGAGATVGKLAGPGRAMKGGVGSHAIVIRDRGKEAEQDDTEEAEPLVVAALAAVNALGDVIDPATGEIVAGTRTVSGDAPADARRMLLRGAVERSLPEGSAGDSAGDRTPGFLQNTTLVVVATNARLDKTSAHKVAQMAHDGLARAISPVHTPFDGDTVFVLATGSRDVALETRDLLRIGALAAEATARSIVRAVRAAEGLPGLPSASDLEAAEDSSEGSE